MHHHDHQVGVTSTDDRNPRGIGSTQMRVSSPHDEIRICKELAPGESFDVSCEQLDAIQSIALEAREIGDPSNVTPHVEFELGGAAFDFRSGPFQWFAGGHFQSPFGADVTDLMLVNHASVSVIVRGSILPESLKDADAGDDE